jgi:alpha-mannosidase
MSTIVHHLTALLPCRELEDLAPRRDAEEAEQVLSAWSALWHPALVAAAKVMPHWASAETPPPEPAGHLILVPRAAEGLVAAEWLSQAAEAGATIIKAVSRREEMVAAALQRLDAPLPAVDPELVADFLALGFCNFQVEMLTRNLRYMANLDEVAFEKELVAAADAACQGDVETARQRLQASFDLLHTAREYFYPSEAKLLDLMLVAPSTLGASFRAALANGPPKSLLISAAVLDEMARREPESLAALRTALEAGTASIVGGELDELELPLLPLEAMVAQLERGLELYERHLGQRPAVFGRRRFGMTPAMPQLIDAFGFTGAIHATLDDGRFPAPSTSRNRWEGLDGTTVETIVRVPGDAGRADSFYRLSQSLGSAMDMDYSSVILFAHWPGQTSVWYQDLQRIIRYTRVMGSFTTAADYFQQTGMSGQQAAYKADEYRSPYLRQAVGQRQPDPISRWVRYFARRAAAESERTLQTLRALVTGSTELTGNELLEAVEDSLRSGTVCAALGGPPEGDLACALDFGDLLQTVLDGTVIGFSRAVAPDAEPFRPTGLFVANPCSFSRRICLELPASQPLPEVIEPVQCAAEVGGRKTVIVDVPPTGFAALVPPREAQPAPDASSRSWGLFRKERAEPPPLAELSLPEKPDATIRPGASLRNEFFTVNIDPATGAIRSIFDHQTRGPRLAQQIAMRLHGARGDADENYSIMAADEITIASPGPVLGEVIVRGRLVDRHARRLSGFRQITRIWRGSRIIELEIELDPTETPEGDPWNSYYAARLAWADETASLYRGVNQAVLPTDATQFESPHFVELRREKLRTTLLAAGLPFHRRIGTRKLDSLLVVEGETARRFRLGIAIDVANPMAAAIDFLTPLAVQFGHAAASTTSAWLFHLDARNVLATRWQPLETEGRVVGFRVRLLETEGRRVSLGLRSFRQMGSAHQVSHGTRPPTELSVAGDRITVEIEPYQWLEVEARF